MTRRPVDGTHPQGAFNGSYPVLQDMTLPVRGRAPEPEVFLFDQTLDDLPDEPISTTFTHNTSFPNTQPLSMYSTVDPTSHTGPSSPWSRSTYSDSIPATITPWELRNPPQHQRLATQGFDTLPPLPVYSEPHDDINHSLGLCCQRTNSSLSYNYAPRERGGDFGNSGTNNYGGHYTYQDNAQTNYAQATNARSVKYTVESSPSTFMSTSFGSGAPSEVIPPHYSTMSGPYNTQMSPETRGEYGYTPSNHSLGSISVGGPPQGGPTTQGPSYSNFIAAQDQTTTSNPTPAYSTYSSSRNVQQPVASASTGQMAEFPTRMSRSNSKYRVVEGHAIVEYTGNLIRCECGSKYSGSLKNVRSNFKRHLLGRATSCPHCNKVMTRHDNVLAHVRKFHAAEEAALQEQPPRQMTVIHQDTNAPHDMSLYNAQYGGKYH